MKTEKIIVSELFEKPRRYLIPLFQRGYVWSKNEQWAPLLEDLCNLIDAIRIQRKLNSGHLRKHFLGAIVLQQQNLGVRYAPVSDVIDGQQRLITLQLLLLALKYTAANLNNDFLNAKLERLTENPGPFVNDEERFKVWPTSIYRQDFRALAIAPSLSEVRDQYPQVFYRRKLQPRPQLIEAFIFFCEKIEQYLSNDNSHSQENTTREQITDNSNEKKVHLVEDLLEAITLHVQLVEINLDAEDDPQIIFETLNARGVPLSPSDLIRNFIFLYATRHQENIEDLYEKYWKPFDETLDDKSHSKTKRFWKEEERQGRFKTNRLDLFFFHYLTYKTESDLKIGHIFQEFKDWWESEQSRSAKDELASLSAISKVYRGLLVPQKDTCLGKFASVLRAIDTTTVYPVVFFIESRRSEMYNSEIDGIYKDIESYLVRRTICGLTPKNYNRIFLSLLKHIREQDELSRTSVQQYLLSFEGESVVWPDNDSFRQHFVFDPLYQKLPSSRIQMILEALEQSIATSFQESLIIDTNLSIEHIWPQNADSSDWPSLPLNEDGNVNITAYVQRQNLINSIGNLTLVTPSFNSSLSNRCFEIKRPAIIKESRLRLNAYFQDIQTDSWTEEKIINRGEKLFIHAQQVWARP